MTPIQDQQRRWLAKKLQTSDRGARSALAKSLGVNPAAITRMINADSTKEMREISVDELWKIAEFFKEEPPGFDVIGARAATVPVPLVSWVSAGKLADPSTPVDDLSEAKPYPIAGLPPGEWIALRVDGSSMNKISPPNSVIAVNRKEKNLVPNACYIIADEDGSATYKRFRPGPPIRFEPVTFSDGHETLYPDGEPTIIGRVRKSIIDM